MIGFKSEVIQDGNGRTAYWECVRHDWNTKQTRYDAMIEAVSDHLGLAHDRHENKAGYSMMMFAVTALGDFS